MKVYSLIARPGEPRHAQMLAVNDAFWERGYEIVPFTQADLAEGRLDADLHAEPERTLVVGAVGIVRKALVRCGRPEPPNLDFPAEIRPWTGRRIFETTFGRIRELVRAESTELPLHVKPRDRHKLFKGTLVAAFRDLIPLVGVPNDEPVWAQEPVEFLSEWRATILRGRIVHVGWYKGDPLRFPDPEPLKAALAAFVSRPRGCGMDWGVTRCGRTLLVEVNDGFALGNYGVPGHAYTAMIETRWRELRGLPDNGVGE